LAVEVSLGEGAGAAGGLLADVADSVVGDVGRGGGIGSGGDCEGDLGGDGAGK